MVTFLVVLSGFVLTIANHKHKSIALGKFYVARVARIAPIYLLALWLSVQLSPDTWWIPSSHWLLNISSL